MEDVIQQNTPEELAPLIEALERARQEQEEATGIREALEAEVRSEHRRAAHTLRTVGTTSTLQGALLKVYLLQSTQALAQLPSDYCPQK